MPHKLFVLAYKNGPLGYLIKIPEAVFILLNHKIRDSRLQLFLLRWAGALAVIVGAAMCGFSLMPMFLAAGILAPGVCFFSFLVWLAAGDIFLKFALEDERFYNLATKSHALSVFEDTESSFLQPLTEALVPEERKSLDAGVTMATAKPAAGRSAHRARVVRRRKSVEDDKLVQIGSR